MHRALYPLLFLVLTLLVTPASPGAEEKPENAEGKTLRVLFIGNSFTARHNLSKIVKQMAEAGNPGLTMEVKTVIYGGRTPRDHWRLGSQNFVKLPTLTAAEVEATIASLEEAVAKDPKDKYASAAITRQKELLAGLESADRTPWDVVVVQSYKDDLNGENSLYAQFVPKFAELIHAQGARVILYVTTPNTQNAEALKEAPDPAPILEKAHATAALANQVKADVAPMALVALKCQTERPDLTLRFINDAHLNQTMAYLTACTLYAALFDKSPEGLPVDSVTDIRYWNDKDKTKDRDGEPITRTFSEKDRADLQRIAWEGYQEFKKLRKE